MSAIIIIQYNNSFIQQWLTKQGTRTNKADWSQTSESLQSSPASLWARSGVRNRQHSSHLNFAGKYPLIHTCWEQLRGLWWPNSHSDDFVMWSGGTQSQGAWIPIPDYCLLAVELQASSLPPLCFTFLICIEEGITEPISWVVGRIKHC